MKNVLDALCQDVSEVSEEVSKNLFMARVESSLAGLYRRTQSTGSWASVNPGGGLLDGGPDLMVELWVGPGRETLHLPWPDSVEQRSEATSWHRGRKANPTGCKKKNRDKNEGSKG